MIPILNFYALHLVKTVIDAIKCYFQFIVIVENVTLLLEITKYMIVFFLIMIALHEILQLNRLSYK